MTFMDGVIQDLVWMVFYGIGWQCCRILRSIMLVITFIFHYDHSDATPRQKLSCCLSTNYFVLSNTRTTPHDASIRTTL